MSGLSAVPLMAACVLVPLAREEAPAAPAGDATVGGVAPCPGGDNSFLIYWDDVQAANGLLVVRDTIPASAREGASGIDYSFDDGRTWARAEGDDPWVVRFHPDRDTDYRLRIRTYDAEHPRALPGPSRVWRIRVVGRSRGEEALAVFRQMIRAYEQHDERGFLRHVSRTDFSRDYMVFQRAILNEFRTLSSLRIDPFIERVTPDGHERHIDFRWIKQWEDRETGDLVTYRGRTEFRFREIDCRYQLVDYRGDLLFGHTDPDLLPVGDVVVDVSVGPNPPPTGPISAIVTVRNDGSATIERVEVRIFASPVGIPGGPLALVDTQFLRLRAGQEEQIFASVLGPPQTFRAEADPDNELIETSETNNEDQATGP